MEDDSDVWPPDDVAEPSEKSSGIFRMAGKVQGPAVVAARLALENATMSQLPPLWGHFPINPLPGYNRRIEPVRARDDGTDVPHAAEHQAVHTQRPDLIRRSRLTEQLRTGAWRALTLVSAPAGFGKTTLVADWVRESGW